MNEQEWLMMMSGVRGGGAVTRRFTQLDGVANDLFQFESPIVLNSDYKITVQAITETTGTTRAIFNSEGAIFYLFRVAANNSLAFFTDDINSSFNTGGQSLAVLNTFVIQRIGTTVTIRINGVLRVTLNLSLLPAAIDVVGGRLADSFFNGRIANLLVEDNGTLVADCPLDEDFSSTIIGVNRANGNNNLIAKTTTLVSDEFTLTGNTWDNGAGTTFEQAS